MTHESLALLRGRLVASVQASAGAPARDTHVIGALAESALLGGASGLRLNGPEDIRRVRPVTDAPIIGLHKVWNGVRNVITPERALAAGLAEAGADIIAVDATTEQLGTDFRLIGEVAAATGRPVMADVSTVAEGERAWAAGAAVVGTT
ncbi:N-acetylmannosamine-6-phosphate 2-epimerase, partial [Salmonella enterica subsp. enterica serovar Typhimurium]|nr:N-acetylmannosamine-6-phosphate 2-epimerase [Salmonella enterica subsp. enterica serovar Typhimurium]